jgi:pilus assembly protein CpaB
MSFLRNRTVLGVICIALSLFICFAVTPLFNSGISKKTDIVRVARDIKAGEQITRDMVKTVEVGSYNLPDNVVRSLDAALGKYVKADCAGRLYLNTKLTDSPAAENAYLYNLTGEKQAMSVTIKSFSNGLSGKLISGDIVSVIAPDYRKMELPTFPRS